MNRLWFRYCLKIVARYSHAAPYSVGECANCGKQVHLEMAHEDGDEIFCSEECAIEYRNDHEEEDEEDGD